MEKDNVIPLIKKPAIFSTGLKDKISEEIAPVVGLSNADVVVDRFEDILCKELVASFRDLGSRLGNALARRILK
jgi:hypothetical protein